MTTSLTSPFQMHLQDQCRDAYCHLANMKEDIVKISFAYDITSRAMSSFGKLLWPLSYKQLLKLIWPHRHSHTGIILTNV